MKTLTIPAAMRRLHLDEPGYNGVTVDHENSVAIASDGEAMVVMPVYPITPLSRAAFIPRGDGDFQLQIAENGEPVDAAEPEGLIDWKGLDSLCRQSPPVFRVKLDAARLLLIAQALGSDVVELEFRASLDFPILISGPEEGGGFLSATGGEGLMIAAAVTEPSAPPVTAEIRENTTLGVIEVHFTGKPDATIRETLKAPDLAFRWSGDKGTKSGIPPRCWYGPLNPYTKEKVTALLSPAA